MEIELNLLSTFIMIIALQNMALATDAKGKVKDERPHSLKPSVVDGCSRLDPMCGRMDDVKDEIKTNSAKSRHIYRSEEIVKRGRKESLLFVCDGDEFLDFSHVCNVEPDCSNVRDEQYCFLDEAKVKGRNKTDCNIICPDFFTCFNGAVVAENKTAYISSLVIVPCGTKKLQLSGMDLSKIETPHTLPGLITLELSNCSIKNVSNIFTNDIMANTLTVDLSLNDLKQMKKNQDISIFQNMVFLNLSFNPNLTNIHYAAITAKRLMSFDISYTGVSSLNMELFAKNFKNLRYLNLKYTKLSNLAFLSKFSSLDVLNIEGVPFTVMEAVQNLRHLKITKCLYTDSDVLCWPGLLGPGIPNIVCHAPGLAHPNCQGLLPDPKQKYIIWFVAILSLCSNIVVIVYRVFFDSFNCRTSYGILVLSLAIADSLVSVYLVMIASVDSFYSSSYILTENAWRHSHLCAFASYISTCAWIISNMSACLIALDRFLVMKNTFGKSIFMKKTLTAVVAFAWLTGVTVASVPHLHTAWMSHTSNGLCLALPFTTAYKRDVGPFSIGLFLVAHTFLFLFIVASLLAMLLLSIYKTNRSGAVHRSAARRREDMKVGAQICLIAFSHLLSWCPVFTLGVLTQYRDYVVSPEIYAWVMIICFPINAVLNPAIYSGRAVFRGIFSTFRRYKTNFIENRSVSERAIRFRSVRVDMNDQIELQEL